jgi:hypothetical protein
MALFDLRSRMVKRGSHNVHAKTPHHRVSNLTDTRPLLLRTNPRLFFVTTKMVGGMNKVWSNEWTEAPPARIWEHFLWTSERILTVPVVWDPLQRMMSSDGTSAPYPEAFGGPANNPLRITQDT